MRKVLFTIIGIIVLALSSSEVIAAEAKALSTPPSGVVKAPPGQAAEKQVTAPAKAAPEASRNRERAPGPDHGPLLRLLWLLTGSSKSR